MAVKVVVLGSVDGKIEAAFQKLGALHAKNSFDFAIITGNLFAAEQDDDPVVARLLNGELPLALTTYFTVGTTGLPGPVVDRIQQNEDVCENLHFLGKRSVTKTSDGVRIVTLGGVLDKEILGGQSKEQYLPLHTVDDAKALRGANSADILLTTLWPSGIWNNSTHELTPENKQAVVSTEEIAELCTALKPRYHFAASPTELFYEREPFFYPASEEASEKKAVTRFISMAPFGNSAKQKALYAFNLQLDETTTSVPAGSTMTPFLRKTARKRAAPETDGHSRFSNDRNVRHRKGRGRDRSPPPGPDRCYFCLSNPNLPIHMVCSIGDDAYITTAKGPLPGPDFFAPQGLDFPCHQLIIPLSHEPTIRAMGADCEKTFREMANFRTSLQRMVAERSQHQVGAVTWEISRVSGIHYHWQFLPAPVSMFRKGLVEAAFKVEAENLKYPSFEERAIGSGLDEEGDFFRLWLWHDNDEADTVTEKELVMRLDDSFRFDLQFARRVMAKLLGLESRVKWQDVAQTEQEETQDVEKFKEAFKKWDPSLKDA